MARAQWVRDFAARLILMRANRREFPGLELDAIPDVEDLGEACRIARQIDSRAIGIVHRRNYGDPAERSTIGVLLRDVRF